MAASECVRIGDTGDRRLGRWVTLDASCSPHTAARGCRCRGVRPGAPGVIWRGALIGVIVALLPLLVAGHDRRIIEGDNGVAYMLESWFRDEPAVPNQANAIVLAVTRTGPGGRGPVAGLEKTLRIALRGDNGRQPLALTPRAGSGSPEPASRTSFYEAPFRLTDSGNYQVRLVGEIEGVPVKATLFSHQIVPSWLNPVADPEEMRGGRGRERQRAAVPATPVPAASVPAAPIGGQTITPLAVGLGLLGVLAALIALWLRKKKTLLLKRRV